MDFLLLQTGDYLLKQDGDRILLAVQPATVGPGFFAAGQVYHPGFASGGTYHPGFQEGQ